MPAPVVSSSSARGANKVTALRSHSQGQIKKTRVVRRRGRAKDTVESDDEIVREVGTDSESEDELSSLDSASDSDTEPASEEVIPNSHSRVLTPSTSQSPGDVGASDKDLVARLTTDVPPFFAPKENWSEMVADETTNGPADLPVIEFADFDGQIAPPAGPRTRKAKKAAKNARPIPDAAASLPSPPSSIPGESENETGAAELVASTSRHPPSPSFPKRPAGQTARQAYQQRLESDPSYVPTVGGFWGHDDRLLDKDLRSLSGWWRGRWQGRGRARGFPMRGRGRGGAFESQASQPHQDADDEIAATVAVPPIERAWTHDGFEEMKQREEQRRAAQQPQSKATQPFRGAGGHRGGRGFVQARGGRGGTGRGGFSGSPTRSRVQSPFTARVWFVMKPELMWTKQHEAFLHFDLNLKARHGRGTGFRVKLPGNRAQIIRTPPKSHPPAQASTSKPATASVLGSEIGERAYTVRLPVPNEKKEKKAKVANEKALAEDIFKVRRRLVERDPIPLPESNPAPATDDTITSSPPPQSQSHNVSHQQTDSSAAVPSRSMDESSAQSQLEQLSLLPQSPDPTRQAQTEEAVLRKTSAEVQPEEAQPSELQRGEEERPLLPSIQTVFTPPVSQASPVYGSPYGYGPALPLGIAMNQHGMPYEIATGRPVYLQPPPPPMYNPRPIMHSHMVPPSLPFVPGHMQHHSTASPDFLTHPASHTPPMNGFIDPTTGTPIFSFPRQTSRIEIRAPSEHPESKVQGKSSPRRPSGLRTAAAAFEPSRPSDNADQSYFPSVNEPVDMNPLPTYGGAEGNAPGDDGHGTEHHMAEPVMLGYPPYPQQYYYPEGYAYPAYMDMSHVGQYEMYPDSLTPQGAVYY